MINVLKNFFFEKVYALDDNYVIPKVDTTDPTKVDWNSIIKFLLDVISLLINFAGVLAFLLIVYAALMYAFAYGDESKVETAKKTITWALIGLLMVGVATFIIGFIRFQLNTSNPVIPIS